MTKIEWTDQTWNPVTGCDKVSQGCKNCYAEIMHKRLMGMFPDKYSKPFLGNIQIHEDELMKPIAWKKPRMVFVNSMSDLFHDDVPYSFIYRVFAVMDVCRQHTFQVLTKRPARMLEFMKAYVEYPGTNGHVIPNVWLGVSCEDQKTANERIPILLQVPAAVRFLSCEPLLGAIDLSICTTNPLRKCIKCGDVGRGYLIGSGDEYEGTGCRECDNLMDSLPMIDWVIVGGESGHHARPMHPDWVRSIRNECHVAGVPFFFKQWGEWMPLEFDAQPPFRRFSSNNKLIDGHAIDVIDPETGEAGRMKGMRFMDAMDAITFCMDHKVDQCDFLHRSKEKFPALIDRKYHVNFPLNKTKTTPHEKNVDHHSY